MKWLTFEIQREPGFRFNLIDLGLIAAVVAVTFVLRCVAPGSHLVWLPPYVGLSFFLFCNVFRISRGLELVWSGVFLSLAACSMVVSMPAWPVTCLLSLFVTVIVVAVEMRKPSYHGAWWQRINPGLQEWWNMRDHE